MIRKNILKRGFSILLVAVLVLGSIPTDGMVFSSLKVEAFRTVTPDKEAEVTISTVTDPIVFGELKRLVNESKLRAVSHPITFGELIDFEGEIDLSGFGSSITNVIGLGYARSATKFNLSGLTITNIGDDEFYGCALSEIILPDTLRTIGKYAFGSCTNLVQIALPMPDPTNTAITGVTALGEGAFSGCTALLGIDLSNITALGDKSFMSCTSFTKIEMLNDKVTLGTDVFNGCSNLLDVDLPSSIKKIPTQFFTGTSSLDYTVFSLPDSIIEIGDAAFSSSGIRSLDLTNCIDLKLIGKDAFSISDIQEIILPDKLETIGELAFQNSSLFSIKIPESVTEIGEAAFFHCEYLFRVELPSKLTQIKEKTFGQCKYLMDITIRDAGNSALSLIGEYAFEGCGYLKGTQFLEELTLLTKIETGAFRNCALIQLEADSLKHSKDKYGSDKMVGDFKTVILPDCVVELGEGVFLGSSLLKVADLGDGITKLPANTFSGCSELIEVTLPKNLTEIGTSCFESCFRLQTVNFPKDSLQIIGDYAFSNNGRYKSLNNSYMKAVSVIVSAGAISYDPSTSTTEVIGYEKYKQTFDGVEKTFIKSVYIDSDMLNGAEVTLVPNTTTPVLNAGEVQIYVERDSLHMDLDRKYLQTSFSGSDFMGLNKISIPDSVTQIGKYAFQKCVNLEEVKLPSGLLVISEGTFLNCSEKLLDITNTIIPNVYTGLTSISPEITSKFKDVKITDISKNAFQNCYNFNLENGALPTSLVTIGDSAFNNCYNLTKVNFESRLKTIGVQAFMGCSRIKKQVKHYKSDLTEVSIDEVYQGYGLQVIDFQFAASLESIGRGAFQQTAIESCVFPANLQNVPIDCFKGCTYLSTVKVSDAVTSVGANAFYDNCRLKSLTVPATTTLDPTMLAGFAVDYYQGDIVINVVDSIDEISVGNGQEAEVPIYIASTNATEKISIAVGEGIPPVTNVNLTWNNTTSKNGLTVYSVRLQGKEKASQSVTIQSDLMFTNLKTNVIKCKASKTYTVNVVDKECTSIEFPKNYLVLGYTAGATTGNTTTLVATVNPIDTTEKCEWTYDNTAVLDVLPQTTISPLGTVNTTAKADIVAKSYGYSRVELKIGSQTETCDVYTVVPANSIKLDKTSCNLYMGLTETDLITSTLSYNTSVYSASNITAFPDRVAYTSSNDAIVTVDENGKLTAKGIGVATISATALGGARTATCVVNVYPNKTTASLSYNGDAVDEQSMQTIKSGQEITFDITTDPADSLAPLAYTIDDVNVVSFKSFIKTNTKQTSIAFRGAKPGITTVNVYAEGSGVQSAKTKIKVYADATAVSLKASQKLAEGATLSILNSLVSAAGSTSSMDTASTITTDRIVFSSDNNEVAKVDDKGVVTGIKAGTANITVICNHLDGTFIENTQQITVFVPDATSIQVSGLSVINTNQTTQLIATLTPSTAVNAVTFTPYATSDSNIIDVTSTGLVTGKVPGTAKVRATTNNGKSATFSITVKQPATNITFTKPSIAINVGGTYNVATKEYVITPTNHTDTIKWSSQNPSIATVVEKSGRITGVGKGTTNITLTTLSGATANLIVEVRSPATTISIPKTANINVNETFSLIATLTPADTTDKITWSTSNAAIAEVSTTGVVTAKAKGTCNITAKTDSGRSASCSITVKLPATTIKIKTMSASFSKIYVKKGMSYSLKYLMAPLDTTDIVTWKSSKKKVATIVPTSGVLLAKKKGTTTITATTTSGKKASIKVYVVTKEVKAKKVKIASKKTIKRKKMVRLTPTITKKTSTETLRWTSSKPQIATVNEFGEVTGIKKGKTVITVSSQYGKISTCKVTIK